MLRNQSKLNHFSTNEAFVTWSVWSRKGDFYLLSWNSDGQSLLHFVARNSQRLHTLVIPFHHVAKSYRHTFAHAQWSLHLAGLIYDQRWSDFGPR